METNEATTEVPMKKRSWYQTLDVLEGGKLPPPPTYRAPDGSERESAWIDITPIMYPDNRRLMVALVPAEFVQPTRDNIIRG